MNQKWSVFGNLRLRKCRSGDSDDSLQVLCDDAPVFTQALQRKRGVGRTGRRQTDGLAATERFKIAAVKPVRRLAVTENSGDPAFGQNRADIVRPGVFNAAVA